MGFEDIIAGFDAEFPPALGPERKSEFIVASVGSFVDHRRERLEIPEWDAFVARNAAAILAEHGG